MAEMLRDADSTAKHLSTVRRHMRMCNSVKGAAFLSAQIKPAYESLKLAREEAEKASEDQEDARDAALLEGYAGADLLRTTSERAQQYDREGHGDSVFEHLFPEGGFGAYLTSSETVTAATARVFVLRLQKLGAGHALYGLAGEHDAVAAAIELAEQKVREAVLVRHTKEAEEEVAQAALRAVYEDNYLDGRKALGKRVAERLFPKVRKRGGGEEKGEK